MRTTMESIDKDAISDEISELEDQRHSIEVKIALYHGELTIYKDRIEDLCKKISDIDETYTVYENLKTEITKRIDSLEETSVCIKEIKKDTRVVKKIDHALKKLEYVRSQLSSALSNAQSDYDTVSDKIDNCKRSMASIDGKINYRKDVLNGTIEF